MTYPFNSAQFDRLAEAGVPVPAMPYHFAQKAGLQALIAGEGILCGWSVHNASGAAANLLILDGTDANGQMIAVEHQGTGNTDNASTGARGLYFGTGITVSDAAGAFEGVIWAIPL